MPRKPRADDDEEDVNTCIGTGSIGDLRDGAPRGRRVSQPIGFVHFPDRPEKARAAKSKPVKRRKRTR